MPTDLHLQLLTHYALGELPAERLPEVEALLADDPEARAWVAGVRRTAAALGAELAAEASAGLDASRKAAIARRARPPLRLRPWLVAGGALAAAGLALAVSVPGTAMSRRVAPQPPVTATTAMPALAAPALTVPAAQPLVIPLPPDEPDPAVVIAHLDAPADAADAADAVTKGREEAVAESELGGMGSFMAIGSGGSAGMFGSTGSGQPADSPQRTAPSGQQPAASAWQPAAAGLRYAGFPQPPVLGAPADAVGESYAPVQESVFQDPQHAPLSTFGLDVDTASYANVRRFIEQGRLPPRDAVRIEELLNAFAYADPPPGAPDQPFAVGVEVADCPWSPGRRLARIAVAAATPVRRPPCNLVFLVDVSGSMDARNKLPLVKTSLQLLTAQLREEDRVAIVTYADTTALALPSTPGGRRGAILAAVERLQAAGSTNGSAGIQLAYRTAQEHAIAGGVNRVILCTDGDFNLGISSPDGLRTFIAEQRRTGVTLTALGFGMGNLKDANLQILADTGDGTHAYIDSEAEARTSLVDQLDRHLVMVAKDAKVQVEFNPARVAAWRLIGYEKRHLRSRDFADDRVDSGDVGAGAHVVALYELETRSAPGAEAGLRYQGAATLREDAELLFVQLRWKRPDRTQSELLRLPVVDRGQAQGGTDFRFAAAVAAFGLALRDSPNRGAASLSLADELARDALGDDPDGRRRGFIQLIGQARRLAPGR